MKDIFYHGVKNPSDLPVILNEGLKTESYLSDTPANALLFAADDILLEVKADTSSCEMTSYNGGLQIITKKIVPPEDIIQVQPERVNQMREEDKKLSEAKRIFREKRQMKQRGCVESQ